MEIREDRQSNPVVDEVGALVAVTRPVIAAVLQSISAEVVNTFGERDRLPLRMLGRLRKKGDGDCGIAFEYAVHDAVISAQPIVVERVADALNKCRIVRGDPASILFAIEKSGAQQLISTEPGLVTDSSPILLGEGGRPVGLREHLSAIGAAFRLPDALLNLAQSIRGLWKTDLFLGSAELDRWVGTTVNISRSELRAAKSPRIAIVPSVMGQSDAVRLDEQKNLVICPVPRDGSFLQIFYEGWKIVQALCAGDFTLSGVRDIPNPAHREVARIYAERRDFPIVDVTTAVAATSTIITPIPRTSSNSRGMPDAVASPAY